MTNRIIVEGFTLPHPNTIIVLISLAAIQYNLPIFTVDGTTLWIPLGLHCFVILLMVTVVCWMFLDDPKNVIKT